MTEYRKLIGDPRSDTLKVTLPIAWVRAQGLTAGDAVKVDEMADGRLLVGKA